MKIAKKTTIKLSEPIPVYDVIQAKPNNNFFLKNGLVSHNCGLMDEMEFMKGQNADITKSAVFDFYSAIKRRMESRFIFEGRLPTMLFLVSSKQAQNDFLEQYAKIASAKESTYVVDKPIWEIKPDYFYGGKRFRLGLGNMEIKSSIITDDSLTDEEILKQGYNEVLYVPVELRDSFEIDMDSALRDIAGKSTNSASKFISSYLLRKCYTRNFPNPFIQEVIQAGIDDSKKVSDYFKPELIPDAVKRLPGYIHVDAGLKHDKTGISYVVPLSTVTVNSYVNDATKNFIQATNEIVTMQVFSVGIQAAPNSEVSLSKVRQFFVYLRENGFNIQLVTYDGYQSADSVQLLNQEGINSKVFSLDRNNLGYDALNSSIRDGRIILSQLQDTLLEVELVNLERTPKGKIDHPVTSSKDISDSLAGANYQAIISNPTLAVSYEEYMSTDFNIDDLLAGESVTDFPDVNEGVIGSYDSLSEMMENLNDIGEEYF